MGSLAALASVGGGDGSFFTDERCSPWLSRHEQGDSKVNGGDSAAAAVQRSALMMSVEARVIKMLPLKDLNPGAG